MKYGSAQHKYIQKLLVINPRLTVGEASKRLALLNEYLAQRSSK